MSEAQQHPAPERESDLPAGIGAVLGALRSSALLVDASDNVLKSSAPAQAMGLLEGNRITSPELARLVADVRRDGEAREADLVIPRGAGLPPRTVSARVAQLNPRLTLALAEDRTREKRLESIRRDFVVNVSHELKTPVGALGLLAETLVAETALGGPGESGDGLDATSSAVVQRLAARLHHEALRIGRTIDDLLELSRIEVGEPSSQDRIPVVQVLADAVDRARPAAELRDITVDVACRPPRLTIRGDRRQLVSAMANLLDNAIKYSDPGSSVEARGALVDGFAELSVVDHGIGIPQPHLDRVFERFYRVDSARSRDTGGTGLGLAIVRHVVNNHHGEVQVESTQGIGSTFTLRIPSADLPADALNQESA